MNCPKCENYMSEVGKWSTMAGFVYHCSKCDKRYSERDMENWPICPACNVHPASDPDESLCKKCLDNINNQNLSYE